MINSSAVTDCLQTVDTVTIGNCYEPLVYNLILSTPINDEKAILDWLVSENLLVPLLNKTQFETFDDILKKLIEWQLKYYPLNEQTAVTNFLNNTIEGIDFEAGKASASMQSNGITITRTGYKKHNDNWVDLNIAKKTITVTNPLSYVLVNFKEAVLGYNAGDKARMPALQALYIFNKDNRDHCISSAKLLFDVALFTIGVGEIEVAYNTYRSSKGIYAAYVGLKSVGDVGMSIADIAINNGAAQSWSQTPEGRARLDKWNKFSMYYAMASLSANAIDNAIQSLNKTTRNIDNTTEFDNFANELDGLNGAGSLTRGINKLDFFNSVTEFKNSANGLLGDQAWDLWKQQKWGELETLFKNNNINGKWPPNDGFVEFTTSPLSIGKEIDRYGGKIVNGQFSDEFGTFVSPKGASFESRALPENYLTDVPPTPYNKYKVVKEIPNVKQGQAAPWFNQSGMGEQYKLPFDIDKLLLEGYIIPIN